MASQWAKYDKLILEHYKHNEKNFIKIAKTILGEEKTTKDVDLLRTYARRLIDSRGLRDVKGAKVLIFDIETSHTEYQTRVFSPWNQNLRPDDIIKPWYILCWSAKWLFEDEIYNAKCSKKEVKKGDDKRIAQALWNMIDEADVVIAHNLNKFDRKIAQTRFLKNGMYLPSPYQTIDTLLHARKQFKIPSNRLDYLGEYLGVGRKLETEKGLWDKVEDGDEGAMERMQSYCDVDVELLERVYLELRPFIQPHPNLGLFIENNFDQTCPSCGGNHLSVIGEYATTVNTYDAYRCDDCGSQTRARRANTPLKSNQHITSSSPR
jgi:predicted RNA-binding Zn-ribbon protein involved in translation (DUF1610 family)/DNA polymerase elongation subunit (family B)